MVFQPHYRVTAYGFSGTVIAPVEIWSWGFQIGFPGTGGDSTVGPLSPTDRTNIVTAVTTIHNQLGIPTGGNRFLAGVKIAEIQPDGTYLNPVQETVLAVPDPGAGTSGYPYQVAVCVSLRGPLAVRRVSGRFYLPASNAAAITPATGRFQTADVTLLSNTVGSAFSLLNTQLDAAYPGMCVVVASTKNVNAEVIEVRVGDVPDTQRRRRNDLIESYVPTIVT